MRALQLGDGGCMTRVPCRWPASPILPWQLHASSDQDKTRGALTTAGTDAKPYNPGATCTDLCTFQSSSANYGGLQRFQETSGAAQQRPCHNCEAEAACVGRSTVSSVQVLQFVRCRVASSVSQEPPGYRESLTATAACAMERSFLSLIVEIGADASSKQKASLGHPAWKDKTLAFVQVSPMENRLSTAARMHTAVHGLLFSGFGAYSGL